MHSWSSLINLNFLAEVDLEQHIKSLSVRTVVITSIIVVVCCILAVALKKQKELKLPLFLLIAGSLLLSTGILFANTIYLNVKSESKGPVHWHADAEFWSCGLEVELRDPKGFLSNKIGSSTYHEHNDKRIHLEGVVIKKAVDASLGKFMRVIDGYLTDNAIALPLNDDPTRYFVKEPRPENYSRSIGDGEWIKTADKGKVLQLKNGNYCAEGEPAAEVQAFVYTFDKKTMTYSQQKLNKPADYKMRDEQLVPPGDCLIIEYDQPKSRTDKLCFQYGIRDAERCVEFGVKEFHPELCNIREVNAGGSE